MKFCWCTITVDNMEESLKFYQEVVGLSVSRRFVAGPGTEIAFLGDGETKVELISNPIHKATKTGGDVSLGFEVSSLDEKMKLFVEKGLSVEGPYQPTPNIKYVYVKDPSGVKLQFVQNL